jgi:hypothetical protein
MASLALSDSVTKTVRTFEKQTGIEVITMQWRSNGETRYLRIGEKKNIPLILFAFILALCLGSLSWIAWESVYGRGGQIGVANIENADNLNLTFGENTPITQENFPFVFGALISLTLFAFLLPFLGFGQIEELHDQGDHLLICKLFYGLRKSTKIPIHLAKPLWNTDIWRYSRQTIPGLFGVGAGLLILEWDGKKLSLGKGLRKEEESSFRQRIEEVLPEPKKQEEDHDS